MAMVDEVRRPAQDAPGGEQGETEHDILPMPRDFADEPVDEED